MKVLRWPPLLLLMLVLVAAAYNRNSLWHTPLTLWEDVARSKPNSARVRNNLGNCYMLAGRVPEAIAEYRLALQLDRFYIEAYYNLGTNLEDIGQSEEALRYYQVYCSKAPWGFRKTVACERAAVIAQTSEGIR